MTGIEKAGATGEPHPYDTVLRSRRVVFPDGERPAAVAVANGRISAIADYDDALLATENIDLGRDALLPGLVDSHVHINQPGRTHWEGFRTATAAAAAGGVTTVIDMPLNSLPPTVDLPAFAAKRAAARGRCSVDVGFWGGAVPGNLTKMAALHEAGVYGFKCFLSDSGVSDFPPLPAHALQPVLREIARLGSVLLVHAEHSPRRPHVSAGRHYEDFLRTRPQQLEVAAVAEVMEASALTGGRAHIVHVSSCAAAELGARAKADGVPISLETCPHYLVLEAGSVPPGATEFKCCPPIRGSSNRERLWALLEDGTLDCVVSDHSPAPSTAKATGDFGTAWGGIASLELGLPLMWTQASRRGLRLADVVRWMSAGPAQLVGLADRGAIAVGNSADLVWFAPDAEFTIDKNSLRQRHPISPYHGLRLRGMVRTTWLSGTPTSDGLHGRLLRRGGRPSSALTMPSEQR